ncbi:MAG: gluconate 2-dehydrogenase subunit 3 family protein [Salinibacter sp.]|uniref:gluconate 2-dehydrogenase subunit 3 family protein n=1 Tax=Salinibacter sp. TaxID=2065818 RepID=UPI0035D47AB4
MSTPDHMNRRQALGRVGALLGGIVSAPTVAGVLSGCERISGPDWAPQTLTAEQNEMVDTIAEIIIPTTDTPGASAANVNRFIDALVGESYLPKDRDRFLRGLDDLNTRCKEKYGASFTECTGEQQRALVGELDDEKFGADAPEFDRENPPFFRMMKELTIIGYYTSEVGATQELKTSIVPGYYDGDVPYEKIGRAWSGAGT